jgi:hypothetical protein
MRARRFQATQILAVTALVTYTAYVFVSQPAFSGSDEKLAVLLSWSHYGSVLPRMLLWYVSVGVLSTLVIGLLAVALNRQWGVWLVLAATAVGFALIPFSGAVVQAAAARSLGGIAMLCVLSILGITFLQTKRGQ